MNDFVLPVAATLAALAFAAPATAAVVPGQGIAGVELRMTEAQVRAVVGPPLRVTRSRGALGLLVTRLHYRGLDVDLQRLDRHSGDRDAPASGRAQASASVRRSRLFAVSRASAAGLKAPTATAEAATGTSRSPA